MNNNVKFISTIANENDFEELVRRYVESSFGVNAYLIGGPWDNGKDLVYKTRNKEIREAAQISIEEKNIETKIDSDLKKVLNLVEEHDYPPTLNFFWSRSISEYRLDSIRTSAKIEYGITIEFYDAKRISQDLTNKYPEILNYLIKDIHKVKIENESVIDIKQRTFYEYLVLSKDSANLKIAIADSNIISILYESPKNIETICLEMKGLGIRKGTIKGRIQKLIADERVINEHDRYMLSDNEKAKIDTLTFHEISNKNELLLTLKNETIKYTQNDLSVEILEMIKKAYEASVDVQLTELEFEPPKTQIINGIINDLNILLKNECELSSKEAEKLSKKLVDIAGNNDYLSEYCSAKLCINLLNNRKLEKYIENKTFFIYFDAPVLIPYLSVIRFSDNDLFDKSLKNVKFMKENINALKNKRLRATSEHFEETVRHLEQADKISQFVTDELIRELGESKNVFFNIYLRWKRKQPDHYNFTSFLYEFIGIQEDEIPERYKFDVFSRCVSDFLKMSSIDIIDYANEVQESYLSTIKTKLTREMTGRNRNQRTIENDIICSAALGDDKLHCDEDGFLSTPMLITLDSTQYTLRNVVRKNYKFKEWLVYTPQRAIERLSMLNMKIAPESLKDGILATISDEYFFKGNSVSIIDTLSYILGNTTIDQGDIINLATKLKRKITEESLGDSEIDIEKYNIVSQVLLYTHDTFKSDFDKVTKLFTDEIYKKPLVELLLKTTKSGFNLEEKNIYSRDLKNLIKKVS